MSSSVRKEFVPSDQTQLRFGRRCARCARRTALDICRGAVARFAACGRQQKRYRCKYPGQTGSSWTLHGPTCFCVDLFGGHLGPPSMWLLVWQCVSWTVPEACTADGFNLTGWASPLPETNGSWFVVRLHETTGIMIRDDSQIATTAMTMPRSIAPNTMAQRYVRVVFRSLQFPGRSYQFQMGHLPLQLVFTRFADPDSHFRGPMPART